MDLGLKILSEITKFTNECSLCHKTRYYKTKQGMTRANEKKLLCKSCINSIKVGGGGYLIKDNKKLCSYCNNYKDLSDFYLDLNNKYNSRCISCQIEYNSKYHANVVRFDRYNITKTYFLELLLKQNNKCAICDKKITERTCHIDHCHKTKKVRGLLCGKCNKGLGQFDDNIKFLKNAIKYLK